MHPRKFDSCFGRKNTRECRHSKPGVRKSAKKYAARFERRIAKTQIQEE
jgi:hypothetical protein